MYKLIFIFLSVSIFFSCSNGKIEYRNSTNGCINKSMLDGSQEVDSMVFSHELTEIEKDYESLKKNIRMKNLMKFDSIQNLMKQVYLINESYSKTIQFTVKYTSESNSVIGTALYKLNPGEEKLIGCNWKLYNQNELSSTIYQITGEKISR